jgi:hypothetical protein
MVHKRFQRTNWAEHGFDLAIVFALISIGIFVRLVLAYHYRLNYGLNDNWGGTDYSIVWNRMLPLNLPNLDSYGWADFHWYYRAWITGWYEQNWYPYQWQAPFENNALNYYSYPPVFVYFLVLTWRPGANYLWMALPMVVSDAACAAIVYLIVKNIFTKKYATHLGLFAGFLMALAPINIVYDGIYWLNPGPVTLLTIIAFFFAVKKKWWQAFFWLAIATMTKQNALFFTYPLFMAMLGQKVREKSIKEAVIESIANAFVFVGVALLLSVPWIFISPYEYGRHMLFPGRKIVLTTAIPVPASNDCIPFARSIQVLGIRGLVLKIIAFGTYSMFWMVLSSSIIAVFMLYRSYIGKMDGIEFFEWISVYTIFSHIFMPRGVYKFYTAYYIPMIIIALLGSLANLTEKKSFIAIGIITATGLFFGFNFWLLTINRNYVPFFLFTFAILIGLFGAIRSYFRERRKQGTELSSAYSYFNGKIGTKITRKQ